jgi:hypothetical protein
VISGDHEGRDVGLLETSHLANEMPERLPRRAGVMEDITAMDHAINASLEDVVDHAREGMVDIDCALVATTLLIELASCPVAQVRI